jgi:hypothetical protein
MEDKTGGPAFPVPNSANGQEGMTLRDYFADGAMQGLMADNIMFLGAEKQAADSGRSTADVIATFAYQISDSMLKERGK